MDSKWNIPTRKSKGMENYILNYVKVFEKNLNM